MQDKIMQENAEIMRENAIREWYLKDCLGSCNSAWLIGVITEEFQYSHRTYNGETYYYTVVDIKRRSGTSDFIKVIVPNSLLTAKGNLKGMYIDVKGEMCSYRYKQVKRQIDIYLFAREVRFCTEEEIGDLANINAVFLSGYICKGVHHKVTYSEKEITELVLAINQNDKSNYIPCITWGRMAQQTKDLCIGDFLILFGRMQSREYTKVLEDGTTEIRTTYEMSTRKII